MADEILTTLADHVFTITLNRVDKRNALTNGMVEKLERAATDAARRTDVRVVVVAAAGPTFCAGLDLREFRATPWPGVASSPSTAISASRPIPLASPCRSRVSESPSRSR